MSDRQSVLDVLTIKTADNRPVLSMSVDDINAATNQPTEDTAFDGYTESMFADATRIELHMDRYDTDSEAYVRAVDGDEATWDSSAKEVTITLNRDDTAWSGVYTFEWVCIYDTGGPVLANATDVTTVPNAGYFQMDVVPPTNRDLQTPDAADRAVGVLTIDDGIVFADDTVSLDASGGDVSNVGALDATTAEASDTFTDPAGVAHTGELADVDDTGIAVEDDGTTVLQGVANVNFGADASVTDDGDGSVTVDVSGTGTNTHTDVSEAGTQVLTDVQDINFTASSAAAVTVSDDGDGSATVDVSATDTDTRTDIEDGGTAVVSDVTAINFGTDITVSDDGDGSVTVDVSGTDTNTHTDVSDDGTAVVSDVDDINFGTDIGVTDDGDGSVTVDAQTTTDTRIDVSNDGSLVVSEPSDVNFAPNLSVTDDGDGTVTVDLADAVTVSSLSVGTDSALMSVAATGQVALSSGTATVDTGVSATDATFYLALGVDDPDADCEVAGKLLWDDSVGTYHVTIDEVDTAVGNPTVNYDVLRVR